MHFYVTYFWQFDEENFFEEQLEGCSSYFKLQLTKESVSVILILKKKLIIIIMIKNNQAIVQSKDPNLAPIFSLLILSWWGEHTDI